jgi:hypothetical protein
VSAVAPAPCIGTAWAPRTSRAAFPVTASAFAIAWLRHSAGAARECRNARKGALAHAVARYCVCLAAKFSTLARLHGSAKRTWTLEAAVVT